MTRTIEPLTHQIAHGQYAAWEIRAAENMMSLIAQWDVMPGELRAKEYAKDTASKFHEVPGFEPRYCANCQNETHFDFRYDPEGECGKCGAWDGQAAA